MKHRVLLLGLVAAFGLGMIFAPFPGQFPLKPAATAQVPPMTEIDRAVGQNAARMIEEGRRIFRFDTFGDEVWFGDTLKPNAATRPRRSTLCFIRSPPT